MQTYDVLSLTQNLIRYPSVTPESGNIIQYLEQLLTGLGFQCDVMTFQTEGRPRVSNLFARYGTGAPHLCYGGHVDVVPVGTVSHWTYPPFDAEVHNHILYGRGAVDMKGSIGAFIAAVASKLESGSIKGSISLLITGDEEGEAVDGTVRVLEQLKTLGQIPDVCLVGEPTSEEWMGDIIKVGRRGSLSGHIRVKGRQGHVAYPHRADNPVRRIINFLEELQDFVWDKGDEFFDPSNLEVTSLTADNIAVNVIPPTAEAQFNIRYNPLHTTSSIMEKIEALVAKHCPDYELTFKPGAEPFMNQASSWANLVADSVESVTGKKPLKGTSGGTSDARFIHTYCPVVELGLLNHTAHQVDEHVSVDHLRRLEEIYRAVLDGFFA
jgi:succinyl-diaminopimelate desuccinylase